MRKADLRKQDGQRQRDRADKWISLKIIKRKDVQKKEIIETLIDWLIEIDIVIVAAELVSYQKILLAFNSNT